MKTNATKKIIIIDDDQNNLDLLKIFLVKHGFIIETANNGADGLRKIKNNLYNIIISDIQMPIMDGLELIKKLKKLHQKNLIILMSSMEFKNIDKNIMFLKKPINLKNLLEILG